MNKFERSANDYNSLREITLIRACIFNTLFSTSVNQKKGKKVTVEQAINAIYAYEYATWTNMPVEGTDKSVGTLLRESIFNLFSSEGGQISSGWFPFANLKQYHFSLCGGCGEQTTVYQANMRIPGVLKRRVTICPRCGIVEDSPVNIEVKMTFTRPNLVRLAGNLPQKHWKAGIILWPSLRTEAYLEQWRCGKNGYPANKHKFIKKWPKGPVRLSVILLWETSFLILSQVRRETCK